MARLSRSGESSGATPMSAHRKLGRPPGECWQALAQALAAQPGQTWRELHAASGLGREATRTTLNNATRAGWVRVADLPPQRLPGVSRPLARFELAVIAK
jgi:hypothetical protein